MKHVTVERVGLDQLDATWNPFQSQFWAQAKRASRWHPFAFSFTAPAVNGQREHTSVVLVLVRRLLLGMRLAYIPFGPEIDAYEGEGAQVIRLFSRALRPLLPKGIAFIRFDLPWSKTDNEQIVPIAGRNIRLCRESVQPEGTARIDLTQGYDAVRLNFRERARRNIRKAKAQNIVIKNWDQTSKTFDAWYAIYLETAKRDGFTARPSAYIKNFLTLPGKDAECHLYLAYDRKTLLGGAIILETSAVALYLYGASLRVEGCSPSYLLQDYAIKKACDNGCAIYDFYGISGPFHRGSHLEGLRLFKRAFGGYVCYRHQSLDYVYKPFFRVLYAGLEHKRYQLQRRRFPHRMSQQYSVSTEE
ncbi:MAG: peptidoglycan bridge formation glycyltransferase FemA/FemB family protein [Sphaerochaetaceae bacterium]|nr:peptidoglycan bridge formation glycyltransferase FemA/FemB family protein [Sphaerochaetaceae bacterium]